MRVFRCIARFLWRGLWAAVPEAVRVRLLPYEKENILPELWQEQYAAGAWDYLEAVPELGRYSMIIGFYAHYRPGGSLLDVGCGEGILQRRLRAVGYARYVGIDGSEQAITRAQQQLDSRTEFCCADAEIYTPEERFDVIVFNEVLYYLSDPVATFLRLARMLNAGGILVVSMYRSTNNQRIWRAIERVMPAENAVRVANPGGFSWIIKIFRQPNVEAG